MISATAETTGAAHVPNRKSVGVRLGLWIAVALVFVTQVALIFWVGDPPPVPPVKPVAAPLIYLNGKNSAELLALQDPTLFVLPHRDNFSGEAWLKVPSQNFTPTNWSEPAQPLELPPEQLGAAFAAFMETNRPPRYQPKMASGLYVDDGVHPPTRSISVPSALRVEGDLARLRLLTPLHLPPQTNSDLLTNTVIQLLVNAEGYPYSAVLLSGSGSPDADAEALTNYAKAVRFAPAQEAALGTILADKMTMGKLIFEWQSVAPAPTNAPATAP